LPKSLFDKHYVANRHHSLLLFCRSISERPALIRQLPQVSVAVPPDISPLPVNMAFLAAIDAFLLVGLGPLAIIKSFG
jgi:hypothetical protein